MAPTHGYAEVNGQRLHYAAEGAGPLVIFLHGFPELWYAWRRQLAHFGRTHLAVAPDMRGYNLSSRPDAVADYALPALVEDVAALVAHFGRSAAAVVGHDWGGVVAWELARARPELVERLVIVNAPHPAILRRELARNPEQQRASAYIARFRQPAAEAALSAGSFAALQAAVLAEGLARGYLTEADRQVYLAAWAEPGALTAALNYYRAADFEPGMAEPPDRGPAVAAPTLVIWGEDDRALLPGNLDGLERHVPRLRVERVAGASHWIVHERPELVNALVEAFLAEGGREAHR